MVTPAVITEDGQDLAPLFAGPVRWGYEIVKPASPMPSPERGNPPVRRQVKQIPQVEAAGLRAAVMLATVGAVGIVIMDSALGVFSIGGAHGATAVAVYLVNLVAAVIAFHAARAWQRSGAGADLTRGTSLGRKDVIPFVNAVVTFLIPYIVLSLEAVIGWFRILKGKQVLVPDPADSRRADEEYAAALSAWQDRITQFEAAERRRYESVDMWFPVPLSSTARMICVFGGIDISWDSVLCTLGASLLGNGARIMIGDLSRRHTTGVLRYLCGQAGMPLARVTLPGGEGLESVLAGLDWIDLSTILVEVLHSAQADADVSRRERQEDRAVIREVARCLDRDGAVSITRLREALLVVQGAAGKDDVIGPTEYDRLSRLYNDVQRQHGGVLERITRIERALRDFDVLDDTPAPTGQAGIPADRPGAPGSPRAGDGSLEIIEVEKQSDDLDNDRLVDLLFQLLLRQVRKDARKADVLIVLGADRIRRAALESLIRTAEHEEIGVLLFFEHLRDDAVELIGTSGGAAAFFKLGNHKEAKEASDFIGAQFTWVESQHTKSTSESLNSSWNEQTGETFGPGPGGSSRGRSYSESYGKSTDYSTSEQRVREAVVEPEVLMGLPVTGMIYVEVLPGGRRVAASVDCNPEVARGPRVARQPRALMPSA